MNFVFAILFDDSLEKLVLGIVSLGCKADKILIGVVEIEKVKEIEKVETESYFGFVN